MLLAFKIHYLILFLPFIVMAKPEIKTSHKNQAVLIMERFSKAKNISAHIKKVDEKPTLGSKTSSSGELKYSAGKFYLQLNADQKTELYFKGGKLTLVDYPDLELDKNGVRKVTHVAGKTPAFLNSLIDLFSNSKTFFKQFKIINTSLDNGILSLNLKPAIPNLKKFKIEFSTVNKTIDKIEFTDDVDTQTTIQLSEFDLEKIIPKATFDFKVLKSDQEVTQ